MTRPWISAVWLCGAAATAMHVVRRASSSARLMKVLYPSYLAYPAYPSYLFLWLCRRPILADSDVDGERNVQRVRGLHSRRHQRRHLIGVGLWRFEEQLIVDRQDHPRRQRVRGIPLPERRVDVDHRALQDVS